MNKNKKTIDFQKTPYRGVFQSVAGNLNISPQAVRQAYWRGKVDVVSLINKEVKRINSVIRENNQLQQEANELRINRAG